MSEPERRVLRWAIPVDGIWHGLDAAGPIVHIACRRNADPVEVWTIEEAVAHRACAWQYRVFGTGQPVEGVYVGTALSPLGLVWHLFSRETLP